MVGQASLPVDDVGQPFQAVVLTGWKAGPTVSLARATYQLWNCATAENFRIGEH